MKSKRNRFHLGRGKAFFQDSWARVPSPSPSRICATEAVLLDLFRALAAILVVVYHARIYTLGESEMTKLEIVAYTFTSIGTPAVFWFFALSGYLVGGSAIGEVLATGRLDFRRYFISRLTRLYIVLIPALLLTGLIDYIRIFHFGRHYNAGFETISSHELTTLLGNLVFLQTTVVPTYGSNLALWSLANEFWYYLLFPLLLAPGMVAIPLLFRLVLFMAGLAVLAFLFYFNLSIAWLFLLWCMGAIVRVLPIRLMRSRGLAIALSIVGLVQFPILHPQIGPIATLVVGLTFTNMLMTLRKAPVVLPPVIASGAQRLAFFSFSLYIVHMPFKHLLATIVNQQADPFLSIDPRSLLAPAMIFFLTTASVAFAYAFSMATEAHTEAARRMIIGYGNRRRS